MEKKSISESAKLPPAIFTGEQLLKLPSEELRLWDPFLRRTGISFLVGSSDVGKSMLLRQFAVAIATGATEFLGKCLHCIHKSVMYVSTEDDETIVAELLKKQVTDVPGKLDKLFFLVEHARLLEDLDEHLSEHPADVVIIDSFGDVFKGRVKESEHVRRELEVFYRLSLKHRCQILFLHHTGKKTDDNAPSKHNVLGSQAIEAKSRLVFELRRDPYEKELRHLCVVKGNYVRDEDKRESIELKFDVETLTFAATGNHTPLEELAKPDFKKLDAEKYQRMQRLTEQGVVGDALAEELGYSSRYGVTKLKQRNRGK